MQIFEIHIYFNRCCHSSTHLCAICRYISAVLCHCFKALSVSKFYPNMASILVLIFLAGTPL